MRHEEWERQARKWRANWRDTLLLLREFRWPLLIFSLAIAGGGVLYYFLSIQAGEPVKSIPEAIYLILVLTFLQPLGDFPQTWFLEIFYFVMPVVGIGILAQGVADFGVSFFNRRNRNKEWETAVASTFNQHVILVGLGHVGYRVVRYLQEMNQDVVVVEINPQTELATRIHNMDIPIIADDATRQSTLEAAGVEKARSIILCTQNDSLNLQVALKARSLNPTIHVVVRIFDDDFAQALQEQFGFSALSATGMAAPAFAAAGAGVDVTRPITVEGTSLSLARLSVNPGGRLANLTVGEVEKNYEVSVVLLRHDGNSDFHPVATKSLSSGDALAILGGPKEINNLVQDNGHT